MHYNPRGELVEADHEISAHERAYSFDGIGNRTETVAGTTSLTATPDYTANSLNQYSKVEGTNLPAGAHDDDGNLVDDGTREFFWDSENRLIRVTDGSNTLAEYVYDFMGRRIAKRLPWTLSQWEMCSLYFYHDWNLIAEIMGEEIVDPEELVETYISWETVFSYTWGLDLSQGLQGAGGVGGLLVTEMHTGGDAGVYYPTFDGNGNVSEYLDSSGAQVAHYQYDPFGNQLSLSSGTLKDMFPHRFSTKYHDPETGFYYYGYRCYDPVTGRWPSRDPIEEEGGVNLYGFVGNASIGRVEIDGRKWVETGRKDTRKGYRRMDWSTDYVHYTEENDCCVRKSWTMNSSAIWETQWTEIYYDWEAYYGEASAYGNAAKYTAYASYALGAAQKAKLSYPTLYIGGLSIIYTEMSEDALAKAFAQDKNMGQMTMEIQSAEKQISIHSWITNRTTEPDGLPPCYRSGFYEIAGSQKEQQLVWRQTYDGKGEIVTNTFKR